MAHNNPIAITLRRFLSGEQSALLVHGPWGLGKTYSVKEVVSGFDFKAKDVVVAKSYVSLFGRSSLSKVQRAIFSSAEQVARDEFARDKLGSAAQKSLQLSRFVRSSKFARMISWTYSKISGMQIPWVGDVGQLFNEGNYDAVCSFLVVIDDLERATAGLAMKDVLGLVDDLTTQKSSKVIVICNEDALDEGERQVLDRFREKVFDAEIKFERSPAGVAEIGVPADRVYREASIEALTRLGIRNIRIARKFSYFVDSFWAEISTADASIVQEVLEHAAILTWARYDATAGIPQDRLGGLAASQSWMKSALRQVGEKTEPWEAAWESAVDSLKFSSEPYDADLVEYLLSGNWKVGALGAHIEAKMNALEEYRAKAALRGAWDIYGRSLNPDPSEFIGAITAAIKVHGASLPPRDADGAFAVLEDLTGDASELAEEYLRINQEPLRRAALEDWPFGDFKSKALSPIVAEARVSERKVPTLDEALERISVHRSWSDSDVEVLHGVSDDQLRDWIKSEPPDLMSKVRDGLLRFRGLSGGDPRYAEIARKAERVLARIGMESELNRIRVENMYKVKVGEEQDEERRPEGSGANVPEPPEGQADSISND